MTGKIVGYLTLLPAVWSVSSQEEADERRLDVDGAPPAVDRRDCVLTYAGRGRASSFAAPSLGAPACASSTPAFHVMYSTCKLNIEVKWALESVTMNKASGGDGIPVEIGRAHV